MLAAGTVLQGYRIDGVIGEGGMGVVYSATQTHSTGPSRSRCSLTASVGTTPSASASAGRGCSRRRSTTRTSSPSTKRVRASTGSSWRCGSSGGRTQGPHRGARAGRTPHDPAPRPGRGRARHGARGRARTQGHQAPEHPRRLPDRAYLADFGLTKAAGTPASLVPASFWAHWTTSRPSRFAARRSPLGATRTRSPPSSTSASPDSFRIPRSPTPR